MRTLLLAVVGAALATACSSAGRTPARYRDDTQRVLAAKSSEMRACYDAALKKAPGVGGKVTVRFEVAELSGKVQNVTLDRENTSAPDIVSVCVTRALTGLLLSPPDEKLGQATFVYEFVEAPAPPKG